MTTPRHPSRRRRIEGVCLLVVLISATWLRVKDLDRRALWVDEAESSLNALTILETGLPRDSYLGQPIYENTLVAPWPEHPEFEFRDISYSRKGLATYHGWLPLYSIAASLALHGIGPAELPTEGEPIRLRDDLDERRAKTRAARLPAVLYGLAFLGFLFLAVRAYCGSAAAWASLTLAAYSESLVWTSQQARYYAPTLCLSAVVLWLLARLRSHGGARSWAALSVALAALFHTHLLTFTVACGVLGLVVLVQIGSGDLRGRRWRLPGGAGLLLGALTVPWLVFTGFFQGFGGIPPARVLLSLADVFTYPWIKVEYTVLMALGVLLALTHRRRASVEERTPTAASLLWIPVVWCALAYALFLGVMPAASFFYPRLSLVLQTAGLLLAGAALATAARFVPNAPRRTAAVLLTLVFLLVTGRFADPRPVAEPLFEQELWAAVADETYDSGTRFYSTPNDHLVFTYYADHPVQSIAPVRRDFLDAYPGRLVILERISFVDPRHEALDPETLRERATESGVRLSVEAARGLSRRLAHRPARQALERRVASVRPEVESVPSFAADAFDDYLEQSDAETEAWSRKLAEHPVFRGFAVRDWSDWWQIFFYRFVDPDARRGVALNYATRARSAIAEVPDGASWVVLSSPAPKASSESGLAVAD